MGNFFVIQSGCRFGKQDKDTQSRWRWGCTFGPWGEGGKN